jgi:hypothetical protein
LALNLILNLWLTNFTKAGEKISAPKEGVYLRDSDERLYCYEEA